jgi:hypothetical protein
MPEIQIKEALNKAFVKVQYEMIDRSCPLHYRRIAPFEQAALHLDACPG